MEEPGYNAVPSFSGNTDGQVSGKTAGKQAQEALVSYPLGEIHYSSHNSSMQPYPPILAK